LPSAGKRSPGQYSRRTARWIDNCRLSSELLRRWKCEGDCWLWDLWVIIATSKCSQGSNKAIQVRDVLHCIYGAASGGQQTRIIKVEDERYLNTMDTYRDFVPDREGWADAQQHIPNLQFCWYTWWGGANLPRFLGWWCIEPLQQRKIFNVGCDQHRKPIIILALLSLLQLILAAKLQGLALINPLLAALASLRPPRRDLGFWSDEEIIPRRFLLLQRWRSRPRRGGSQNRKGVRKRRHCFITQTVHTESGHDGCFICRPWLRISGNLAIDMAQKSALVTMPSHTPGVGSS